MTGTHKQQVVGCLFSEKMLLKSVGILVRCIVGMIRYQIKYQSRLLNEAPSCRGGSGTTV